MSSLPVFRPAFVGREREIAHLRAALEHARSSKGGLVLLSGPPGIGKSRIVAEFVEEALEAGTRVLFGRSWEAGGAPAYWPWVQALRGYLRTADGSALRDRLAKGAPELSTLLPELEDLVGVLPSRSDRDPATERFRLFDATLTFLQIMAESGPLVLVLEDIQAADVPSVLLLQFVGNHLAETGVVIVATYRDVELTPEHPVKSAVGELRRLPTTSELALDGLDVHEVTRFLEATAGSEFASRLSGALHHRTRGNPLFLSEAVRLMVAEPIEDSEDLSIRVAIPAEIRSVIERRLEVLSPDCLRILEALSVLGNDFDVETAARYSNTGVDDLLERLGEAVAAGLVVDSRGGPGTFGFAHDLVRQTLYTRLSPAVRVRSHRKAANVLELMYGDEGGEHLAELALHYFEAVAGGDREKAVEFGRRAGEQALRSLAYEEAVRLFEMSVQTVEGSEPVDRATLGPLLLELGDARVRADDLHGGERAFLRAADIARQIGDAGLMGRAAAAYGGRFVWARAGHDTKMVPLLQDALVMLGGSDDELRVRLLSRLACATRSVGDREKGAALARQAVQLARRLGDPATLIYALSGMAGAIWWPETPEERLDIGREMIEIGLSADLVDGVVDGHMTMCTVYAELGDFAKARDELRLLSRAGERLPLSTQRWLEGAMTAVFALSDGLFDQAEPLIDEMRRKAPVTPARDNASAATFQLFLLRREQGRLLEIEESVGAAAAEFSWYPIHQLALADLLRLTGRSDEARRRFEELAAGGFSRFDRDNYWLPSMCLAAELVYGLGAAEFARPLIEELTPYAHMCAVGFPEGSLGSVARYLGLLAGAVRDHESALGWLAIALDVNQRTGARPWVAHTHSGIARILEERGDPSDRQEAQNHLRAARIIAADVGQTVLLASLETSIDAPSAGKAPEAVLGVFRREGEYFSIAFNGTGFKLKDSKGLRYLSVLLGTPGREIHVLDLVLGADGVDPSSRGRSEKSVDPVGMTFDPTIDRKARRAYEDRLVDLQDDIDEAVALGDDERAAVARAEQDFLTTELSSALGLGGRDRPLRGAVERARVNVTRTIRSAIAKIGSNDPLLGGHLDATIRTGIFCSYIPDPMNPVHWNS